MSPPSSASSSKSLPVNEAEVPAAAGKAARGQKRAHGKEGTVGKYVVDIGAVEAFLLPLLSQHRTMGPPDNPALCSGSLIRPDAPHNPASPGPDTASSAPGSAKRITRVRTGDAALPVAAEANHVLPREGGSMGEASRGDHSLLEGRAVQGLAAARMAPLVLWVVDEVGRMELLCPAFFPAVWALLETPGAVVLGSIPVPRYGRDIPQGLEGSVVSTLGCNLHRGRHHTQGSCFAVTRNNGDDIRRFNLAVSEVDFMHGKGFRSKLELQCYGELLKVAHR